MHEYVRLLLEVMVPFSCYFFIIIIRKCTRRTFRQQVDGNFRSLPYFLWKCAPYGTWVNPLLLWTGISSNLTRWRADKPYKAVARAPPVNAIDSDVNFEGRGAPEGSRGPLCSSSLNLSSNINTGISRAFFHYTRWYMS